MFITPVPICRSSDTVFLINFQRKLVPKISIVRPSSDSRRLALRIVVVVGLSPSGLERRKKSRVPDNSCAAVLIDCKSMSDESTSK
jgi:hypothetical protein